MVAMHLFEDRRALQAVLGHLLDAHERVAQAAAAAPEAAAGERDRPVIRFGQVSDALAVVRMHERCSPDALFRRFHAPTPRLTWRSSRRLLAPPGGASLLAWAGPDVVGMAVVVPHVRVDADVARTDTARMEFGVLVEDRWQRSGVGSGLLHQAARFAVRQGARDLLCVMQSDNPALLPTIQRAGLTCRLGAVTGSVEVRIPLSDVPPMEPVAAPPTAEDEPLAQAVTVLR